jgi:RNase adaptor protein for sRNA GlmZ degradation
VRRGADRPPTPFTGHINPTLLFSEVKRAPKRWQDIDSIKENLTAEINVVHLDALDDRFCNFYKDSRRLKMVWSQERVLYFQNDIWLSTALSSTVLMKLAEAKNHYVRLSYAKFHPNRK